MQYDSEKSKITVDQTLLRKGVIGLRERMRRRQLLALLLEAKLLSICLKRNSWEFRHVA